MTVDGAVGFLRQMLWLGLTTAGPAIGVLVAVGLVVAIFQAATQVNDQAISFGPRAVSLVLTLVLLGPWMLQRLVQFTTAMMLAMSQVHP